MPHGAPDWYKYRRDSATFPIDDLAELAARLGSIVTFDRRGDVILMDSFESGLGAWRPSGSAPDYDISVSPHYSTRGGYSIKLTGASAAPSIAQIALYRGESFSTRYGLEGSFSIATTIEAFVIGLSVYTGTDYYYTAAAYDHATKTVQVYKAPGTFQTIASLELAENVPWQFNRIKVVMDITTGYNARILLNANEYSTSQYPLHHVTITHTPCLCLELSVKAVLGENHIAYVDDVIATQDEP